LARASPEEAGQGEVDADRLRRVALEGPAQRPRGPGEPLAAEGVHERVRPDGEEGFHELGEPSSLFAATTFGGTLRRLSASTIAARGSISGLRRLAFTRCSGEASTALRVTSEPVPAVGGIATNGADGFVRACPRPTTSR
jgi:hypothetical protein